MEATIIAVTTKSGKACQSQFTRDASGSMTTITKIDSTGSAAGKIFLPETLCHSEALPEAVRRLRLRPREH